MDFPSKAKQYLMMLSKAVSAGEYQTGESNCEYSLIDLLRT